jgi:hypothetical protein
MQTLVVYFAGLFMVVGLLVIALSMFSLGVFLLPWWAWAIAGGVVSFGYQATIGKLILMEGMERQE